MHSVSASAVPRDAKKKGLTLLNTALQSPLEALREDIPLHARGLPLRQQVNATNWAAPRRRRDGQGQATSETLSARGARETLPPSLDCAPHSLAMPSRALLLALALALPACAQLGMAPLTAPPVPAYLTRKEGAPLRGAPPAAAGGGGSPSLLSSGMSHLNYLRGVAAGNLPIAVALFSSIFLFKIILCIPGGTLLNAVAGALFGAYLGVPLVLALSVLGSCGAYLLSQHCGGALLARWRLDARLAPLRRRIDLASATGTLPRMLTSLRMLPLFPQWLVNLGAPHLGIPLPLFVQSTALGLAPYVTATVSAGAALSAALDAAAMPGANASATFASLLPPHVLAALCACALLVGLGPAALEHCCGRSEAGGGSGGAGGSGDKASSSGSPGGAASAV